MNLYSLFATTVFLSSFLLFQVQPLIGKHILPWYGGSSAVWVTAMFFFMVALAVGYIYALGISKLRTLYQGLLHLLIIVTVIITIYLNAKVWPSAITPTVGDVPVSFTDPVLAVFTTLAITIGLPFVLLSSTSSLLQLWYSVLSGKEPFSLYSISNIGSLLGLLSYPLLFEPFFTTYNQGAAWSYGFVVYTILIVIIVYLFIKESNVVVMTKSESITDNEDLSPTPQRFLLWLVIASVPVMVLLAGTSFMTISIAPIPFLWVGPLSLYLISFIFTFRTGWRLPIWFNEICVVLTSLLSLMLVVFSLAQAFVTIVITHIALFAIFHWCHEHLYELRPSVKHLTLFYVALSIGGILGSALIKLSGSFLLVMPIELAIILILCTAAIFYKWFNEKDFYLFNITRKKLRLFSLFMFIAILLTATTHIQMKQENVIAQERNFFGYKAVKNQDINGIHVWSIQHGLTNHGYQIRENDQPIILPVSYYGKTSGIGKAFEYEKSKKQNGINVIVAGLGTGLLAAYCEEKDNFTFLEIDENVEFLAKKYFTYLDYCPQHKVIISDARLAMEEKAKSKDDRYDLIILDAYADDMIPVHLMTSEAIATYKTLLAPEGILAIHISSRYLNLLPVTGALAKANNMAGRHLYEKEPENKNSSPSQWVLFANFDEVFNNNIFSDMSLFTPEQETLLWTDTHSALLPIIRFY